MSAQDLNRSLLRPPILHILRAAGFHSARPSVIDTLTNIAERYLLLLAQSTAHHAYSNHNTPIPDITDVRMAFQEQFVFSPSLSPAEEAWKEACRKPLEEYEERSGARMKEKQRRDEEDTRDVKEFIAWVMGEKNKEIRRIAGLVAPEGATAIDEAAVEREDYLTALKKKHSKTGEESRYQGTVLGKSAEGKPIRIEGGPVDSISEWKTRNQLVARQMSPVSEPAEVEDRDQDMDDSDLTIAPSSISAS